jgi:hypothetical protein
MAKFKYLMEFQQEVLGIVEIVGNTRNGTKVQNHGQKLHLIFGLWEQRRPSLKPAPVISHPPWQRGNKRGIFTHCC